MHPFVYTKMSIYNIAHTSILYGVQLQAAYMQLKLSLISIIICTKLETAAVPFYFHKISYYTSYISMVKNLLIQVVPYFLRIFQFLKYKQNFNIMWWKAFALDNKWSLSSSHGHLNHYFKPKLITPDSNEIKSISNKALNRT